MPSHANKIWTFANSQVAYNLSLTKLKQADGTLLQFQPAGRLRRGYGRLPTLMLETRADTMPIEFNGFDARRPAPPATPPR